MPVILTMMTATPDDGRNCAEAQAFTNQEIHASACAAISPVPF